MRINDKALLSQVLHEADGIEANVATGYHAIEFLLWGQDLNGTGPSVSDLVRAKSPETDTALKTALDKTHDAVKALVQRAETAEAYDQMIAERNPVGNAVVQAGIDALLAQTRVIRRAATSLELAPIEFAGSDGLDGTGAAN